MQKIYSLAKNAKKKIKESKNLISLNLVYSQFLGKKGFLKKEIKKIKNLSKQDRAKIGFIYNHVKKEIQSLFFSKKKELKKIVLYRSLYKKKIDISLPGRNVKIGSLHPITKIIILVEKFFKNLGFSVKYGPEIEDCYHNFDFLNTPNYHPAYSFQDTFWLNEIYLLRTQTSSIQARIMKKNKPPIHVITSGRVYRRDYDKTHTPMFHQLDGLSIDKNVSFSNLKCLIFNFLYYFFGEKVCLRFRPSYFPFTEPSAEVDIKTKSGKWIEILGCGMIHPNVLKNFKVNSNLYSGFAFGVGIERLAMLYYQIKDLRVFFKNNFRFLKQFT